MVGRRGSMLSRTLRRDLRASADDPSETPNDIVRGSIGGAVLAAGLFVGHPAALGGQAQACDVLSDST
jgi:hypothetical protein